MSPDQFSKSEQAIKARKEGCQILGSFNGCMTAQSNKIYSSGVMADAMEKGFSSCLSKYELKEDDVLSSSGGCPAGKRSPSSISDAEAAKRKKEALEMEDSKMKELNSFPTGSAVQDALDRPAGDVPAPPSDN